MTTTEKQFDAVKYMRQEREKLNQKLLNMSKSEILSYFQEKKSCSKVKPSA